MGEVQRRLAMRKAGPTGYIMLPDRTKTYPTVKRGVATSTLGPELLDNTEFDTGSGWSAEAVWSIAGGKATKSSTASDGRLTYGALVGVVGKSYRVQYEVTGYGGSGAVRALFVGNVSTLNSLGNGKFSGVVQCTVAGQFRIYAEGTWTGSVEVISAQEVL